MIISPFGLGPHTSQNCYAPQKRKLTSVEKTEWYRFLQARNLIPLPFEEQNWSGRGQHAEFNKGEEKDIPLVIEKALGHSTTALVQSVLCKRIRLACKTIKCAENHARGYNQGGGASVVPSAFTHCTGHWYIYHWQGPLYTALSRRLV